jgi:hypothetical protein
MKSVMKPLQVGRDINKSINVENKGKAKRDKG